MSSQLLPKEGFANPLGQNLRPNWVMVTALGDRNLASCGPREGLSPEFWEERWT